MIDKDFIEGFIIPFIVIIFSFLAGIFVAYKIGRQDERKFQSEQKVRRPIDFIGRGGIGLGIFAAYKIGRQDEWDFQAKMKGEE